MSAPRDHGHAHDHGRGHGHSHGRIDPELVRSREGLRAVGLSLVLLLATAAVQAVIFAVTGSVALLADLVHNIGDALTAVPLAVAFVLRSVVAERRAGYFVVAAIFLSACVAGEQSVSRLLDPEDLDHLLVLAAAGAIGFLGNEAAAQVRLRAGRHLGSAALVADGNHARADGLVSLAVVGSAATIAVGFPLGDPLIGLAITAALLRICLQSLRTIRAGNDAL